MSDPFNVVREFEAALCEYTGAPFAVTVNSCTMALLLACAWYMRRLPIGDLEMNSHAINSLRREGWRYVDQIRPLDDLKMIDGIGKVTAKQITEALSQWYVTLETTEGSRYLSPKQPPFDIPCRTYVSVPMSIRNAGGRVTFRDEEWIGSYQLQPYPIYDSARCFTKFAWPDERIICVSFHHSKTLGDTQGGAILHNMGYQCDAWFRRARFDGRTEGVSPKDDTFNMLGYHCYLSPDVAARLLWKLSKLPKHNDPLPNDDYPDLSTMEIFR